MIPRRRTQRRRTPGVVLACAVVAGLVLAPGAQAALSPGTPNNPWPRGCALRLGVSIDRSNSILNDSPLNPGRIRSAMAGLVEGLAGSGVEVAVWSFATVASGFEGRNPLALGTGPEWDVRPADFPAIGFTPTDGPSGRAAIIGTVDRIPFASEASDVVERRKGWTNWEAGLGGHASGLAVPGATAPGGDRPADADVLVVVTDGNPTLPAYEPATPWWGPDDPVNTGVAAADAVKGGPRRTRVVAVGVGAATDVANLQRITGGLGVARPDDDYYFVDHFDGLAAVLVDSVAKACGGGVVARKLVPGATPGSWDPAPGWPFEVDFGRPPPTVSPAGAAQVTDGDGEARWAWIGDGLPTPVTVGEELAGRQRLWGSRCREVVAGEPAGPWVGEDRPVVAREVPNGTTLECEWRNHEADPRVALTKQVDPDRMAEPGGPATFEVEVANTSPSGLERLRVATLVDDRFGDLLDPSNPALADGTCPALAGVVVEAGRPRSCRFTAHVAGDPGRPHRDVVTVSAVEVLVDGGDGLVVTASDDAVVEFDPAPTSTTSTSTTVPPTTVPPTTVPPTSTSTTVPPTTVPPTTTSSTTTSTTSTSTTSTSTTSTSTTSTSTSTTVPPTSTSTTSTTTSTSTTVPPTTTTSTTTTSTAVPPPSPSTSTTTSTTAAPPPTVAGPRAPAAPLLPRTGWSAAAAAVVGVGLVAGGAAAVWRGRGGRRRG